jgi:lipopolysaccharide/colanic/teichoic acid biosynthesis glycosyltransferase
VGHFLRRFSLDELPQLWQVVKGEMSLVGPRPFPSYHLTEFRDDFRSLRTSVTPGLTGLWQVSVRSNGALDVQQSLDTYYIRNWSPWLDLHILVRTVGVVLLGKGAY